MGSTQEIHSMRRQPISVFTPSNTPPEVLERIFVQRHRLLEKIVDRLKRSMLTEDKHHVLLIGPRGSGKTNMVTLALYRLSQQPELRDAMRLAWLGEDDTITGLVDLALGIADRLADEYPDEFAMDYRSTFQGLPPNDAAEAILKEIHSRLKHRSLLLVIENMDAAFKGLGDAGQKRWRAFLQETGGVATLATSQQLFDGVSNRDNPFWGFFEIHHLAPLSYDDARSLIRKISVENNNRDLARFLDRADGRYRIRSLHHLAGGNHRMYVLLSEFLTKESLDDLVAAFEALADELTPYFQERIRSLPAQQAKIVQCLAATAGATTVKEIAAATFIDERGCSKQLGELRNKRYVQSEKRGKESYYELAEPLMRLCLEVKNQRGKPLQLIARFLKAWFTVDELRSKLKIVGSIDSRTTNYLAAALGQDDQFESEVREKMNQDYEKHLSDRNYEAALSVAEELQCVDKVHGLWNSVLVKREKGDHAGVILDCTSIIETSDASSEQKAVALLCRGMAYGRQGETEKAISDHSLLIEMSDASADQKAVALLLSGMTYGQQGETEKEISDYSLLIEMRDAPVELKAMVLLYRGITYSQQGESEKAISDYSLLIEMADAPVDQRAKALLCRGFTYGQQGESEKKISDYTLLIEMADAPVDQKAKALLYRGITHGQQGETEKAISDYTLLIEMTDAQVDQKAKALLNRGVTYGQQGETEKAISDYTLLIEMADAQVDLKAHALLYRGIAYGKRGETAKAVLDFTSVMEMANAPADSKAKALIEIGVMQWHANNMRPALQSFQESVRIAPSGSEVLCKALFNVPEPQVEIGTLDEVCHSLRQAFTENKPDCEGYGGTPGDLFWMVLRRGVGDWDMYVATLVPLYVEFGVADKLGRGLTQLIQRLDEGNYSDEQLDQWNAVWQKHGADIEDLQIPLKCLSVSIEVIKTKSDRPLFQLPLEVRSLVRPLLSKTLAGE
jgi:tetratricopeptide (TPR) repeat protein